MLAVGRRRRTSPLAALAEVRGPDKVLVWGFAALFSVEAVLVVAYAVYPIPSIWTLGDEGSVPTFLHSAILATIALIRWSISAVSLWDRNQGQVAIKHLLAWFVGGLGFLYLSMDEAMECMLSNPLRQVGHLGIVPASSGPEVGGFSKLKVLLFHLLPVGQDGLPPPVVDIGGLAPDEEPWGQQHNRNSQGANRTRLLPGFGVYPTPERCSGQQGA